MMNWSGGMGATGWVLMSIFWVVLIVAIVWAMTALFGGNERSNSAATADRPEEILDRRLARGEINHDTYDTLRAKLQAAHAERL